MLWVFVCSVDVDGKGLMIVLRVCLYVSGMLGG